MKNVAIGIIAIGVGAFIAFGLLVGWWPALALFVMMWANNASMEMSKREERRLRERATQVLLAAVREKARTQIREAVSKTKGEAS
jgi:hypothetical protein